MPRHQNFTGVHNLNGELVPRITGTPFLGLVLSVSQSDGSVYVLLFHTVRLLTWSIQTTEGNKKSITCISTLWWALLVVPPFNDPIDRSTGSHHTDTGTPKLCGLEVTCLPITSMLARRKCLLADLLLSASSRNDATPVATALRSRLFASVCKKGWRRKSNTILSTYH